jgi:hypothetical protein
MNKLLRSATGKTTTNITGFLNPNLNVLNVGKVWERGNDQVPGKE